MAQHPHSSGSSSKAEGGSSDAPAAAAAIKSTVACDPAGKDFTARELDLQQQRRCALQEAGGAPAGGYVAACLAVKNQHRDLQEWLDWHARLGVAKFYLMDGGSDPPLGDVLAPYVQASLLLLLAGLVVHRLLGNISTASQQLRANACHSFLPRFAQLLAYSTCLYDYGAQHQWMAFIDADEFLVPANGTPADLPALLRRYERYGGLAVNWRMFGSGGHKKRQNSTLLAYTKCYPDKEEENLHVKTIANMQYMLRTAGPHHATYAPGYYAVTTSGQRVDGPRSKKLDHSSLSLHHYVTKSWQDYEDKINRGSGMGNIKTVAFWDRVQSRATKTCTAAVDLLAQWQDTDGGGS